MSQHDVIHKFLKLEAKKETASVSIKEALRLLENGLENPDVCIVTQGKQFLKETQVFQDVLTQFSDPSKVCTATHVAAGLNRLCALKDEPDNIVPSYVKTALKHHTSRVNETALLAFFHYVKWLDVEFVLMAQLTGLEPPGVERINDIFQIGKMFSITPAEWKDYLTTEHDFSYSDGDDERSWWANKGSIKHPAVYEAARHLLFVPAVVLACDQLMSVLMARYHARHGQLNQETIQTQVFIRANRGHLRARSL